MAETLAQAYADYFDIGVAIGKRHLTSHADILSRGDFTSVTAENAMKFESLEPREGEFNFSEADEIVDFAQRKGLKVRGHCLVWHQQTPAWVFLGKDGKPAAPELLRERMARHIERVVGHFKGAVYAWDVVNEAVQDKEDGQLLRQSPWLEILGPGFVAEAFRLANKVDPQALLFYNDYNEIDQPKRERILKLLSSLKAGGVPVGGMGMQGHYGPYWPDMAEVAKSVDAYSDLGLTVHLTEVDMSMYSWTHGPSPLKEPTQDMVDNQTKRYAELFKLLRDRKGKVGSVTFWCVADDATWLDYFPEFGRKNWPTLFDVAHAPKPAYFAVRDFK
jgi:endo-1,4-beta-xylanase